MNTKAHEFANIMLEHMPVGVALFDARDLHLLAANALYQSFLLPEWRGGRAIGHPLSDWGPEPYTRFIEPLFRKVAETSIPYRGEEVHIPHPKRGHTYWNWTIDPVRDSNGHILHFLNTASDVTGQVLARQAPEQTHASLSQVEAERRRLEIIETVARSVRESLDIESIGKAVIDAICQNFNPFNVRIHIADPLKQALHLLPIPGSPGNDLTTKKLVEYIPYNSSFLLAQPHKRRDAIIVENIQNTIAEGIISSDHPLAKFGTRGFICVPLWFKDHFEGTLSATFTDIIRPDGPEVQAFLGCSTHIAAALAHARLHAAIENERARLRAVLDQLPEGVILTENPEGYISYANVAAERIFGIPIADQLGYSVAQHPLAHLITDVDGRILPPKDWSVNFALRGETLNGREFMFTRPDGKKVVILTSTAPLYTENGDITGAVSVYHDITERKSIEQHKNEFLSIASHELRTPITAIQGFAEILQLQSAGGLTLDAPQTLRAITSIADQSQRLTRLIEEMLDISRIENGRFLLDLAPHDVVRTLKDVIESRALTSKHHQLRLVLEGLEPEDALIGAFDEDRIMQVFNNLISNAIKYNPTRNEIEVGLRHTIEKPDEVLVWVKDQGIGIPTDEMPRIFERFHRARNLERAMSGLGIGLYLVKEIVTRHNGKVWAESSEGNGSTFYVLLPLKPTQH